jgi:GDP-4-dehydro-6-deoxy-D-mannose reductase
MKKVLVTGVNGFVGKHLTRELVERGRKVVGVGREKTAHSEIVSFLSEYYVCDLTQSEDVNRLPLENISSVINLAGLAKVGDSFNDPEKYLKINVDVMTVLANEILRRKLPIRFIAISTGAVYESSQPMPLTENSELIKDGSPYAKSKILMEEAVQALRSHGLDAVVVRPFNHIGPGQDPGFLVPDLYQKIEAAQKTGGSIKVGDLTTKRDYTDVRDVVRAYVNLATTESLNHDLYNVCSGKSVAGEIILKELLSTMSASKDINLEQDRSLVRPGDPRDLYGSNERLQNDTGWQPKIALDKTVADFVSSKQS